MNKLVYIVLLGGGLLLMVCGIKATNSSNSDASRFFTGSPTDVAIWMLVAGVIVAFIGLVGTFRRPKRG
jgi:Protein of unknown function (DUF3185)